MRGGRHREDRPAIASMRTTWLGVILVSGSCAIAAGCEAADEEGAGDEQRSRAGSAVSFCEDYYDVTCQQLWRCGCSERALEVCEYQIESCSQSGFFFSLEEGLAKGWLRYHADAAEALLSRMSGAPDACDNQFVILGFDSATGQTFGGVFTGTLDAGSECGDQPDRKTKPGVSYCREGHLCLPSRDGVNRCVPVAAPGEACPVVPGDPGSSCFERKSVDPDGTFTSTQLDLVCVPDAAGGETGTCQRRAADGTACSDHSQCESGYCPSSETGEGGACASKLANGEPCFEPNACSSGRCDFSVDPPACAEASPEGGDCLFAEDCASNDCVYAASDDLSGTCGPDEVSAPLPPGSACDASETCDGGLCSDGVCSQPICKTYDVERT